MFEKIRDYSRLLSLGIFGASIPFFIVTGYFIFGLTGAKSPLILSASMGLCGLTGSRVLKAENVNGEKNKLLKGIFVGIILPIIILLVGIYTIRQINITKCEINPAPAFCERYTPELYRAYQNK